MCAMWRGLTGSGKKNRRACVHGIISINCFQDNNEEEQIPQNTPGLFDVTV